jgi:uncharacterized protein YvpB
MKKSSHLIPNVPVIGQYPMLPTGCEATALTMVLRWAGVAVKKEEVADALVKEPLPHEREGVLVGGNPYRAFIGDPYSKESYGVFHGPIFETLECYLPEQAEDRTGCSFEELLALVASGRPVVVWATIELKEPRYTDTWQDVTGNGTEIRWQSPQHCMTLVGFTEEHVVINDPHTAGTEHYPRELFQLRWEQLGRQAVTVKEK